MGHWNHRVVRRVWRNKGTDQEKATYDIHEAHYDDDGKLEGITQDPVGAHGETVAEVEEELRRMIECLKKPVIEWDDL